MTITRALAASLALFLSSGMAPAEPRIPASDGQVLERLPLRPGDPLGRELAQLRQAVRANPRDIDAAVRLARRYYTLVGEEGDPRYLGYAQAALAPWWTQTEPPVEVQVLRASLLQFRHDFDGAVADLSAVLAREPDNARARALRATIHIVQARYADAATDCLALRGAASMLIATACEQMVRGLTGQAESAYVTLRDALAAAPTASADEKLWALLRLAEMSQRSGRMADAERHFRAALALGIRDTFLLAAYADFLLDAGRPAEVLALIGASPGAAVRSDTLLLRQVLARRKLRQPDADAAEATLAARYAASRQRGETVHEQEEARFVLEVKGDARRAVALAADNWKVQREPRDARVLLEAALAAGDAAAAAPVLQWMDASGIEDRTLRALAVRLGKEKA